MVDTGRLLGDKVSAIFLWMCAGDVLERERVDWLERHAEASAAYHHGACEYAVEIHSGSSAVFEAVWDGAAELGDSAMACRTETCPFHGAAHVSRAMIIGQNSGSSTVEHFLVVREHHRTENHIVEITGFRVLLIAQTTRRKAKDAFCVSDEKEGQVLRSDILRGHSLPDCEEFQNMPPDELIFPSVQHVVRKM